MLCNDDLIPSRNANASQMAEPCNLVDRVRRRSSATAKLLLLSIVWLFFQAGAPSLAWAPLPTGHTAQIVEIEIGVCTLRAFLGKVDPSKGYLDTWTWEEWSPATYEANKGTPTEDTFAVIGHNRTDGSILVFTYTDGSNTWGVRNVGGWENRMIVGGDAESLECMQEGDVRTARDLGIYPHVALKLGQLFSGQVGFQINVKLNIGGDEQFDIRYVIRVPQVEGADPDFPANLQVITEELPNNGYVPPPTLDGVYRSDPTGEVVPNATSFIYEVAFSEPVKNLVADNFNLMFVADVDPVPDPVEATNISIEVKDASGSPIDADDYHDVAFVKFTSTNGQVMEEGAYSLITRTGSSPIVNEEDAELGEFVVPNDYEAYSVAHVEGSGGSKPGPPGLSKVEQSVPDLNPADQVIRRRDLTFRVTFDEDVRQVDSNDFVLYKFNTFAAIPGLTYTVSGTDTATYEVKVEDTTNVLDGFSGPVLVRPLLDRANPIIDCDDKQYDSTDPPETLEVYNIDFRAPQVRSVARSTPVTAPTNADELTFAVAFSEDVKGLDSSDFALYDIAGSGTLLDVTVELSSNPDGSGAVTDSDLLSTVYVTVSNNTDPSQVDDRTGTVELRVADAAVVDGVGNNMGAFQAPTGDDYQRYELDNTNPDLTPVPQLHQPPV